MPYKSKDNKDDIEYSPVYGKRRPWAYYANQQADELKKAIGEDLFDSLTYSLERRGKEWKQKLKYKP